MPGPITDLDNMPSLDDLDTFEPRMNEVFTFKLSRLATEINAFAATLSLVSTTDTSASTHSLSLGAKTFVVSAGKSFNYGMFLTLADTAAPTTNWLFAQIQSYVGTALTVNVIAFAGTGSKSAWGISQSAAGGATLQSNKFNGLQTFAVGANIASAATLNLSTATGNTVHVTGTTAVSAVTMNAGQWMQVIYDAACPLTYHATNHNINTGGQNVTLEAGDAVFYFYDGAKVYGQIVKATGALARVASIAEMQAGTSGLSPSVASLRGGLVAPLLLQATTSGTAWNVTGVPDWATVLIPILNDFSTNGNSPYLLQLGDAGGYEVTGYSAAALDSASGSSASAAYASGFGLKESVTAATSLTSLGFLVKTNPANNTWTFMANGFSGLTLSVASGWKSLSQPLNSLRVTTASATPTGDGGIFTVLCF